MVIRHQKVNVEELVTYAKGEGAAGDIDRLFKQAGKGG